MKTKKQQHLLYHYGPSIVDIYLSDSSVVNDFKTAEDIISYFISYFGPKYVGWIIKQYCNKNFIVQNFFEVYQKIERFNNIKNFLTKKNIYDYKTLDELSTVLNDTANTEFKTKADKKRSIKENEVKYIIDTPNFKVVVPLTLAASNMYGSNTKWCTNSYIEKSFYHGFNRVSPLYIIIANNKKFQLHMDFKNPIKNELNVKITQSEQDYLCSFPEYKTFLNYLIETYYVKHI